MNIFVVIGCITYLIVTTSEFLPGNKAYESIMKTYSEYGNSISACSALLIVKELINESIISFIILLNCRKNRDNIEVEKHTATQGG